MAESLQILVYDRMADVTECSICTEIFTDPKSLPCLHSFCLQCLEKYGKGQIPGDQMACPICRTDFVIPNGGFCNLPNNFFISKMVEIRKLSSTTASEALCATCPEEERVKAGLFCLECEQNLCQRCGVTHSKMKLSQYHQVVEIGKKTHEITFRNSYCDQHPGEIVKMYCEVDKTTICFLCFAESHQTHKCLSVTKAFEEISTALKDDLEIVKRRLPECKGSLEKLQKLKTSLLAETDEMEKEIVNEATRLKAVIDYHVNVLTEKLTATKDKKLKDIESVQQDVERSQIMFESYVRYLEELLKKGAPGDICREANRMKTRAMGLSALPRICCGCDHCWDKIMFQSSNLEDILRINSIANAVGDMQTGSSDGQLLGHDITVYSEDHVAPNVSTSTDNRAVSLEKQHRTIVIQYIPTKASTEFLRSVFENKCNRGGDIDEIDYKEGKGEAFITFKDSSVAAALALRGSMILLKRRIFIRMS